MLLALPEKRALVDAVSSSVLSFPNSKWDALSVKLNWAILEHGAQGGFVLGKGKETVGRKRACDELCQIELNFSEDSMRS